MKVWELHKALADAVGDNADIDSSNLYDGVRYSKEERDSYLYQALIRVFTKLVNPILRLPRKQMIEMVERYFPNMVKRVQVTTIYEPNDQIYKFIGNPTFTSGNSGTVEMNEPAVVISLYLKQSSKLDGKRRGIPIPFKNSSEVSALINSRTSFLPDTFFTYSKILEDYHFEIHDYQGELEDRLSYYESDVFELTFLPYPINPSTQAIGDDIDIETAYVDMVIGTAIILMGRDDQEIEGIERVMPLIEPFMQQGGQ